MNFFNKWTKVSSAAVIAASLSLQAFSTLANASAFDCDATQCTVNLSPALQLVAGAGNVNDSQNPGRIEIVGDVRLIAQGIDLPLGDTQLVMETDPNTGQLMEFYGLAKMPLDEWSILENLSLDAEPPMAVVGLFQQQTVEDLFDGMIPLNNAVALDGSQRQSTQPYLVFHTSTGGLSLDLNKMFKLGMSDKSSFAISIPGQKSVSFALDVHDPYLFTGQDFSIKLENLNKDEPSKLAPEKTYLAINSQVIDEHGDVTSEITEYYDDSGRMVNKFIRDPHTGALVKHDIAADGQVTVSFYQRDDVGDFVREGADKQDGDHFNLLELDNGVDVNDSARTRMSGYRVVNQDERNADGSLKREITEYHDNQGNLVSKFFYDPATGSMVKQDFDKNGHMTVSFYQQDAAGDFVRDGADKNDGDYFNKNEIAQGKDVSDPARARDLDPVDQPKDNKKRRKFELGIDAFAFSKNGWLPYEAQNTYGVPHDSRHFSGNLYMKGAITMDGTLVLDGEVVTYLGEQGFTMGGNGDLAFTIPALPEPVDFSLYLGSASSTFQIVHGRQMAFISGVMQPDTGLFEKLLPINPEGQVLAAGYIDNNLVDTNISLEGSFSLGAKLIGDLIGVPLNNLQSVQGKAQLSPTGFSLNGITESQIHPDIAFGGAISVEVDIPFINPDEFSLKLAGKADVFGVGLDEVSIAISREGMFINGIFVTPLTEMAMLGSITNRGPALTGYATISLGLGDITGAMKNATEALTKAQAEVNRLSIEIDRLRQEVIERRAKHAAALQKAQAAVTFAQNEVNRLNALVAKEYKGISYQKSRISSKYRWYKKAKWYQKAGRWAAYKAEKAWRSAVIAKHYAAIGVFKATIVAAKLALEGAKLSLRGLEELTEVTPVDLDPKVATVIVAKGVAITALEVAKLPFKHIPVINHDFEGKIEATLDITGIHGVVTAEFDGYEALRGSLQFDPIPRACITIATFGEACTKF